MSWAAGGHGPTAHGSCKTNTWPVGVSAWARGLTTLILTPRLAGKELQRFQCLENLAGCHRMEILRPAPWLAIPLPTTPAFTGFTFFFYLQILLVLGERVGFFNLVLEFRWKCQCLRNYPATPRQQRTINLTLPHQIRAPHMFGCGVWQQQFSAPLCLLLEEKTLSICFKFFQV